MLTVRVRHALSFALAAGDPAAEGQPCEEQVLFPSLSIQLRKDWLLFPSLLLHKDSRASE
jgi:hypothetical protein